MTVFDVVVATDADFGIGKNGDLPWRLPRDLRFFKETTTGVLEDGRQNAVIMGRKTWVSIPERFRPLPNRLNVVLTRQKDWSAGEGALVAHSLDEALRVVGERSDVAEVFVVGGGEIYVQALTHPSCRALHITRIETRFDCDTNFPNPAPDFSESEQSEVFEEKGVRFRFTRWTRNSTEPTSHPL
jgi:dihydrofolate reductase/thymidylate synthase